jgi:hypothetical protein
MEHQLSAGLSEGQIAEFVEDNEVQARKIFRDAPLASGATLGLEPVDEIDRGEEPPARSRSDAASRDGDGPGASCPRRFPRPWNAYPLDL